MSVGTICARAWQRQPIWVKSFAAIGGVENQLYWSLDVVFGEDQARMRMGNAAENFSVLRRIALNLFRQDKTSKVGVKTRRLLAASDDAYRLKLISGQGVA